MKFPHYITTTTVEFIFMKIKNWTITDVRVEIECPKTYLATCSFFFLKAYNSVRVLILSVRWMPQDSLKRFLVEANQWRLRRCLLSNLPTRFLYAVLYVVCNSVWVLNHVNQGAMVAYPICYRRAFLQIMVIIIQFTEYMHIVANISICICSLFLYYPNYT